MKELILSGAWFGQEGLYSAEVKAINFSDDLNKVDFQYKDVFLILSYDFSSSTINIPIKKSPYPPIIYCEIEALRELNPIKRDFSIIFKGQALSDLNYKERINIIKDYISKGVIYQVNLTNRFDFEIVGDVKSLACAFYERQQVPYFFCLIADDLFIISGSMELFLSKTGQRITSKPIKGTSKEEIFLKNSKKDRAENLMITDMMRNDLGKVSEIGSVKTTELFKIIPYKTLYQMHSTVEGITKKSLNEIIYNTFPPASVTGAPKIKAVEIIDELEPHNRAYYCGCGGLLRDDGDFVFSVLIRTAFGRGNSLSYYAGCGIVWESEPDRELEEMYLKVKAFYDMEY
ncbi:MAG: anthranilate synthase component I family protein [Thermodesulfovibrionales bacterium]|nr:anthranilate synthase component I family protein [Thermodesulfovibrionales bacterium]